MKLLSAAVASPPGAPLERIIASLAGSDLVERVVIAVRPPGSLQSEKCRCLLAGPLSSGETLRLVLEEVRTKYLLLLPEARPLTLERPGLERMLDAAESGGAGLVYSDFHDEGRQGKTLHPLNAYQPGSVRDDFDFGPVILLSVPALREALRRHGEIPQVTFAGLYDLRLKLSIDRPFCHVEEPLYSVAGGGPPAVDKLFAYVDPRNGAVQKEMEAVFTGHLKRIGAFIPGRRLREVEASPAPFPAEASVVIPVRDRRETIESALESALSQEADFPFNVIVVDNHSRDGTTAFLSGLARRRTRLRHVVPARTDLGIGGCWNVALQDEACGRYAVQLDSDDLYSDRSSLKRIVDLLRRGRHAMVIGSYSLVNERLEEVPPGLIDHREWTDENGHNNVLRVNGLGAPRAFVTSLMRRIGFLNASYGEDYAAALRICREYRIGRIYDSLYLCRRWSGNTDAALSVAETNRNNAFKDKVRTEEIFERQKINQAGR